MQMTPTDPSNTPPGPRWLSLHDVAQRTGVTPRTVRRWLRSGLLPGRQLGGRCAHWRVEEGELRTRLYQLVAASRPANDDGDDELEPD